VPSRVIDNLSIHPNHLPTGAKSFWRADSDRIAKMIPWTIVLCTILAVILYQVLIGFKRKWPRSPPGW